MPVKPTGSIRKHRGRWTARVTFTPPGAGKRVEWRRVANPHNTKAAASDILRAKLARLEAGIYDDPPEHGDASPAPAAAPEREPHSPALTFGDVAIRYRDQFCVPPLYENGIKLRGLKDHRGARATIDRVLVPALGARPVAELTFPELLALRDRRLDAPKLRGGKTTIEVEGKRSIARVNREMSVLRAILSFAVDLGLITRNPSSGGRGKSLVVPAAENTRTRILTQGEEAELVKAWSTPDLVRSRDFFIVAIDTGMRSSELFGLSIADCDLAAGVFRLPWQITKTKRSRIVPMSSRVETIVRARMESRSPARLLFDDLSRTIVRDDFREAKRLAKVDDFRLHDCRATLATRLMQAGLSEREIALITGHEFRVNADSEQAPVLRSRYLRLGEETITAARTKLDHLAVN